MVWAAGRAVAVLSPSDGRDPLRAPFCDVLPGDLAEVELISRLDNVVGAAITEHAPAGDNPGEADLVRRVGAALRR